MPPRGGTGYAPARRGGGRNTNGDGLDRERLEDFFRSSVPGAEPPLAYERIAGGRSNLTYRVSDAGGRAFDPAPPAARHDARLRPRHGPRAPHPHRPGRHRRAGARADRDVRGRLGDGRAVLRHGVRRRARAARRGRGRGRVRRAGDRRRLARGARRHARRPARRRPRRRRARRARPPRRLRRAPAQALDAPVGGSKTRELDAMEETHRLLSARVPAAGGDLARARRLPARQRDRLAAGRDRGGAGLGAVHARRPARRPRPADGLLGRARATRSSRSRARRRSRPASRAARRARRALRASAPAATCSGLDFFVALAYWKLAAILEGVYARYSAGAVRRDLRGVHARSARSSSSSRARRTTPRAASSERSADGQRQRVRDRPRRRRGQAARTTDRRPRQAGRAVRRQLPADRLRALEPRQRGVPADRRADAVQEPLAGPPHRDDVAAVAAARQLRHAGAGADAPRAALVLGLGRRDLPEPQPDPRRAARPRRRVRRRPHLPHGPAPDARPAHRDRARR